MLFIHWLQNHLLSCPFKYLTGIDCPGCGFQRAVIALLQGHLHASFLLYPPAIPILLLCGYMIITGFFKPGRKDDVFKKYLFMLVVAIVLVNYGFKIWGLYY